MRVGGRLAVTALAVAGLVGCGLVQPQPDGEPVTPSVSANDSPQSLSPSATTSSPSPSPPLPSGVPGEPRDIVTDLDVPWSIAVLPDEAALVSLRDEARIVRVGPDGGTSPLDGSGPDGTVPGVVPGGEGGLLGLAVHPDDATQLFVYATTADDNRVTRWTLTGGRLTDPRVVVQGIPKAGNHNGGRMAFGPDGYLYVATGDAGDGRNSQDPESLGGKILRLTADGDPAPGNPTEGSPVLTLGHRNVQGLGWTPDGTMYASEFGQNRLDELNRIEPGSNYGWPQVEGSDGEGGFVDPLVTWPVSEASPSGLLVTADAVYLAALRGRRLWRVPLSGNGIGTPEDYLVEELGRLRDVVVAPDGESLWVLTNNTARGSPRPGDDRLVEIPLR